jgi:hypothetical protein
MGILSSAACADVMNDWKWEEKGEWERGWDNISTFNKEGNNRHP